MKEILTPAFIEEKTKADDNVFQTRVKFVMYLLQFAPYGVVYGNTSFKQSKPLEDLVQNNPTSIEYKVTDDISIRFTKTGDIDASVGDVWLGLYGTQYYQVDPKLYPILCSYIRPKVKTTDLNVEIKYRTKSFKFQGSLEYIFAKTMILLGKHDYIQEIDKIVLTYSTRRYKNTTILTISPKIVFKIGKFGQNHIRSIINVLSIIDKLDQVDLMSKSLPIYHYLT